MLSSFFLGSASCYSMISFTEKKHGYIRMSFDQWGTFVVSTEEESILHFSFSVGSKSGVAGANDNKFMVQIFWLSIYRKLQLISSTEHRETLQIIAKMLFKL